MLYFFVFSVSGRKHAQSLEYGATSGFQQVVLCNGVVLGLGRRSLSCSLFSPPKGNAGVGTVVVETAVTFSISQYAKTNIVFQHEWHCCSVFSHNMLLS